MNLRKVTAEEIINLEKALDFDRYTLHAVGKALTNEIEQARQILDTAEKPLPSELKELCRRVAIYFALFKRSKPDAKPYLDFYLQIAAENTYEQAEAYGFLAYIEIINGNYCQIHDQTPLNIALGILKNLEQNDRENIRLKIFLEKYVPLLRYRDSYLNRSEVSQTEIDDITTIIENAKKYSLEHNDDKVDIDRAEASHLHAAMLIKRYDLSKVKNQEDLTAAKKALETALNLENDFSERIARILNMEFVIPHWMTFTTGQTLADLYRRKKILLLPLTCSNPSF